MGFGGLSVLEEQRLFVDSNFVVPATFGLLQSYLSQAHQLCELLLLLLFFHPLNFFVANEHFLSEPHLFILKCLLTIVELPGLSVKLLFDLFLRVHALLLFIFKLLVALINGKLVQNVPFVNILQATDNRKPISIIILLLD